MKKEQQEKQERQTEEFFFYGEIPIRLCFTQTDSTLRERLRRYFLAQRR